MQKLERIFKAVADRNRLRILKLLQSRRMCVCELAYVLGIRQPSVSRHLKKLKRAGLIRDKQDGFWTDYVLNRNAGAYGDLVLRKLKSWISTDPVIKKDRKKAKKANRELLCCK